MTDKLMDFIEFQVLDASDVVVEAYVCIIGHVTAQRTLTRIANSYASGLEPSFRARILNHGKIEVNRLIGCLMPSTKEGS